MVIDTDQVSSWITKHLAICVPVGCGLLSWFAATRWQAALDHNQIALAVFYFFTSAISGVGSAILAFVHINRLGFFE